MSPIFFHRTYRIPGLCSKGPGDECYFVNNNIHTPYLPRHCMGMRNVTNLHETDYDNATCRACLINAIECLRNKYTV